MDSHTKPVPATDVPYRVRRSVLPEPLASRLQLRDKRPLGDFFGLANFGVNLTTLKPGGISSLRHAHTLQDEFVYVLTGRPTLVTNDGETVLAPGMCVGFKAGTGDAHQLVNKTSADVTYLEVGDRTPNDGASYPDDDLKAEFVAHGQWRFTHKDGTPY
jgi:uncharacterized cupin superfamily protein